MRSKPSDKPVMTVKRIRSPFVFLSPVKQDGSMFSVARRVRFPLAQAAKRAVGVRVNFTFNALELGEFLVIDLKHGKKFALAYTKAGSTAVYSNRGDGSFHVSVDPNLRTLEVVSVPDSMLGHELPLDVVNYALSVLNPEVRDWRVVVHKGELEAGDHFWDEVIESHPKREFVKLYGSDKFEVSPGDKWSAVIGKKTPTPKRA